MPRPFLDLWANNIRANLRKGDVLFWRAFDFEDGKSPLSKYLLFLSDCLAGEIFIFVLPTSQKHKYFGLHARRDTVDIIRIRKGEVEFFKKETIIDLKKCEPVSVEKMAKVYGEKILKKVGTLPINVMQRIDQAVEGAKTLSPKVKEIILNSEFVDPEKEK